MRGPDGMRRRKFLGVLGAAGAAAGVTSLPGCGGDGTSATPIDAGPVSDYTAPVWKLRMNDRIVVGRDATGFFAFSAVCTHQNCTVGFGAPGAACIPPTGDQTSAVGTLCCQCHGSRFTGDGSVTTGPATRGLPHYAVTLQNGRVMVNPGTPVEATARTPA